MSSENTLWVVRLTEAWGRFYCLLSLAFEVHYHDIKNNSILETQHFVDEYNKISSSTFCTNIPKIKAVLMHSRYVSW